MMSTIAGGGVIITTQAIASAVPAGEAQRAARTGRAACTRLRTAPALVHDARRRGGGAVPGESPQIFEIEAPGRAYGPGMKGMTIWLVALAGCAGAGAAPAADNASID